MGESAAASGGVAISVLDGSALIAFLRDEPGAEVVEAALTDPTRFCLAHAINLCEVYYDAVRGHGEMQALQVIQDLYAAGLQPRPDMDELFWREAGRHKAAYRRISLADCLRVALTRRVDGGLLTADHHEFDRLVPMGICPIRFIR